MVEENKSKPVAKVDKYAKEHILQASEFAVRKDLLHLLLKDDKKYSLSEVRTLLNKELKRKVAK